MTLVAGHTFLDTGPCEYGMRWPTIRNTTRADVEQPGIAHAGLLNMFECLQIEARRAGEDARIAAAMEEMSR